MLLEVAKLLQVLGPERRLESLALGYCWFSEASEETLQELRVPGRRARAARAARAPVGTGGSWNCSGGAELSGGDKVSKVGRTI